MNETKTPVTRCQHCGHQYQLGITGTVEGCGVCLAIIRNPRDNSIIPAAQFNVFATPLCTCLEYQGDDENCVIHGALVEA